MLDAEAIKARLAAATPGPWHKVQSVDEYNEPLPHSYYIPEIDACFDMTEGDAEFIIHASADLAALLAENAALVARVAWLDATKEELADTQRVLAQREAEVAALRARLTLTPERIEAAALAIAALHESPCWDNCYTETWPDADVVARAALLAAGMREQVPAEDVGAKE